MRNKIFLSYRRDDSPGYVSRLEKELEDVFGDGSVFRDVEDIPGGAKWKTVLERNLDQSAAVLLVIGPRWEEIWRSRQKDAVNYVAFELERASELGIPVVPVTLDGSAISNDLDLGKLSWLRENQTYDLSDRQGRWETDFAGLTRILGQFDGLQAASPQASLSASTTRPRWFRPRVWLSVLAVLAATGWLLLSSPPAPRPAPNAPEQTNGDGTRTNASDLSGVWRGKDDTLYYLESQGGGYTVVSPDYASGVATPIDGMPGKFKVIMQGVGEGEFALSSDGTRLTGWIGPKGTSQPEYDTLYRTQ